ncbi:Techylectin-5A like protein [Argiope bruennichi]|uniref:Techylectin-5A like protein n=1 Tax=Argiope bruennichi TaxID=94029 RepID=A0A8T0FYA9_ARGBR|nr:Techylectin-5A like protein [Argiope bruennichi]
MKEFFCCSAVLLLIFMDICSAAVIKSETSKPLVIFQHRKSNNDSRPEIQQGNCPKCPKHERPMDCAELRENGITESGVYTIYPRSRLSDCKSIDVYCDMTTDGGGWIVIQRRGQYGNGEDYFVKKWKEFKEGFGNLKKEFWLGNDKIYSITNQGRYAVRFEMKHVNGILHLLLLKTFGLRPKMQITNYTSQTTVEPLVMRLEITMDGHFTP